MSGRRGSMPRKHSLRRMPSIAEDEHDVPPPPLPEKSPKRVHGPAVFQPMYPGYPPPAYTIDKQQYPESTSTLASAPTASPSLEEREDIQPSWRARKGGWCRLALLVLLPIVSHWGYTRTLGKHESFEYRSSEKNKKKIAREFLRYPSPPATSPPSSNLTFPAGSYTFTTALANVSTACTSNPDTFRCYPYSTYSAAPAASTAQFFWTIAPANGEEAAAAASSSSSSSSSYAITASNNPFVPQFSNVPLAFLDRGQPTERMTFNFTMNAAVIPAAPLDASGVAATCYFNGTVMSATIWTRLAATFPAANLTFGSAVGAGAPASSSFADWPYAVEIAQVASAGLGVPDCRSAADGSALGSFALAPGSGDCECFYSNYEL
ncbi:hypothetical protein BX600DRAFT_492499 [Xylariales sp. PMI_506]|nr:hypothetical protein BX600DRAFT_492499 [Xylariales sp. PMI_506]